MLGIWNLGRFDRILATGAGTSKIGGLPHNKTCITCNLYPIITSAEYTVKELSETPDSETFPFCNKSVENKDDVLQAKVVPDKDNFQHKSLVLDEKKFIDDDKKVDTDCDSKGELQEVINYVDKDMSVFSSFDKLANQVEFLGSRMLKFSKLLSSFMNNVNDDFAFQESKVDQMQLLVQESIELNESGFVSQEHIGEDFASFIETDFEYSMCETNTDSEILQITKEMVDYIVDQENENLNGKII